MNFKKPYRTLIYHSIISRVLYITICTLSHHYIPHYDKSGELVSSRGILPSLYKWDAFHYNDIAVNGYIQEHTLAFFPLLPLKIRTLSHVTNKLIEVVGNIIGHPHYKIDIITVGIVFNNIVFLINALLLYKLTLWVFDEKMAIISFYLFIYFQSSFYNFQFFVHRISFYVTFFNFTLPFNKPPKG